MNAQMTVANTILEQLGGQRFIAMTGARDFLGGAAELQFSLPRNDRGINKIRIELTPADEYRVHFYRMAKRGLAVNVIASHDRVYAEDLQPLFRTVTGLATSL